MTSDGPQAAFEASTASSRWTPTAPLSPVLLTARESQVMDLIVDEPHLSREQIARRLRISPQTLKWHLRIIREKYDTSSTLAAAVRHERRRWQTSPA